MAKEQQDKASQEGESDFLKGEFTTSYLDYRAADEKCHKLCETVASNWMLVTYDAIQSALDALFQSGMDAQKTSDKIKADATTISQYMRTNLDNILINEIREAHCVGFFEGKQFATTQITKLLEKAIEEGLVNDENGFLQSFVRNIRKHDEETYREQMKGKNLNIYPADPDDEDGEQSCLGYIGGRFIFST